MAEARQSAAWDHTAAILAMVANVNRDPRKSRPLRPADFHPYGKGKGKQSIAVRAANIELLKPLARMNQ